MQKNLLLKTVFIIAVLLVFAYGIVGIPKGITPQALKQGMMERVHLGLDLRGGTHLILQVMVNDAINADSDRLVDRIRAKFAEKHISYADIAKPDPQHPETVQVKGVAPDAVGTARDILNDEGEYETSSGPDNSFVMTMKPSVASTTKTAAVTQAIETIRSRIDQLGVSEPVIQEHGLGDYQILVQLPGVDDPARVKEIIQNTAMLELKQSLGGPYPTEAAAMQANNGVLPPNSMIIPGAADRDSGDNSKVFYVVQRSSVVSGRDLRGAQPTTDQSGRPAIDFYLTNEGGKHFQAFTAAHIGDNLAIVLNNGTGAEVKSAPRIDGEISDTGIITGRFTQQQANDLAMVLRTGSLPAGIRYLEERTVGPSLGADSIRHGVTAAIVGMAVVMIFMLVYYRLAGINADLALILNLVILLGFLGFTGATLTLPGIAGVILTVGMGVDSNVLIFERIREELRAGKSAAAAVDQGFGRAWITIVDTHITTIVSAFILFMFGTGPVRGFAVTLTFGLLANLFTAVFVSRVIFEAELKRTARGQALSI
ncbi:MAG: protein translocase subunit SecD [Terriglobales bacterium]|jgi:preprotein translocase subunit SecD